MVFFGPCASEHHAHLFLIVKKFEKNMWKNSTNHAFFEAWVNKLYAHLTWNLQIQLIIWQTCVEATLEMHYL
jgi:hypothetical protein